MVSKDRYLNIFLVFTVLYKILWYKSCCFLERGIPNFGTTEFSFFPCFSTRSERRENCWCFLFRILFLGDILSALLLSLSVLYTVYFVVRCCDLCGVLMYLFILFQLFRIYNETKLKKTNHKTIFSVFLFPSLRQAICNNWFYSRFHKCCFEIHWVCFLIDTQQTKVSLAIW